MSEIDRRLARAAATRAAIERARAQFEELKARSTEPRVEVEPDSEPAVVEPLPEGGEQVATTTEDDVPKDLPGLPWLKVSGFRARAKILLAGGVPPWLNKRKPATRRERKRRQGKRYRERQRQKKAAQKVPVGGPEPNKAAAAKPSGGT